MSFSGDPDIQFLMKIVFPGSFRCLGIESAIRLLWLSLLRVEKYNAIFNILVRKMFLTSKIKNSQCGEVRLNKFFQIMKELIKIRLMRYFSSQTDEMLSRTIRISDIRSTFEESSTSPPGGNQVDGLPPASSSFKVIAMVGQNIRNILRI